MINILILDIFLVVLLSTQRSFPTVFPFSALFKFPMFHSSGSLQVPGGADIVPIINKMGPKFKHIYKTIDWHPADHISFYSNVKSGQYKTAPESDIQWGKLVSYFPINTVLQTLLQSESNKSILSINQWDKT